jgi:membrane-associated phospholipid phosphatase
MAAEPMNVNRINLQNSREEAATITWPAGSRPANDARAEIAVPAWVRRELATAWAGCGAFEWIALGYLALSSVLIAVFAHHLPHLGWLMLVQAGVAAFVLILCRLGGTSPVPGELFVSFSRRACHFGRHWYPHLFFLFCFEELGYLVHLVFPGWHDAKLIAFDHWLTGVHPAIWLEQFSTPLRNDFMQFTYLTYFTYLLILGGILYHRRDWHAYWSVMAYSATAYVMGYLVSIFFPIQSPWHAMAGGWQHDLVGGPFTALINFIEHYGRVRGAAFPSEHVAGAFAALWGAWRHRRWLFWTFLPFVLCMCVSTIYGRYHYVADVLGGMLTGTLGYWLGLKLMRVRGAVATTRKTEERAGST